MKSEKADKLPAPALPATAKGVADYMQSLRNETHRKQFLRFFKTAEGQYGHGDDFLGIKVPQTRAVVQRVASNFPLAEVPRLLHSPWHEVRLCGLLILVHKFERQARPRLANNPEAIRQRDEIVQMYLENGQQANNWDLVDLSAPKILGHWLMLPTALGDDHYKLRLMDSLAESPSLWLQRIGMVCTWKTSQLGNPAWCLRYAERHLNHKHDLMHKAVGWMLREMGKRVSMELLRDFLRQHGHEMPRTALRYAIELMPDNERTFWLTTTRK